jgi:5-methylcytosine-specific restriction endonuclease McrA
VLALFDGVDEKTSIELYLQKLQGLSVYHIDSTQKSLVACYYLQNKNRIPHKEHKQKVRKEFASRKHKLRQEWSAHYSLKWPMNATNHFQAHHIVPINSGGVNKWWNISPISDKKHSKLHSSIEEHACFSHNLIERKTCRLVLKIKEIFCKFVDFLSRNSVLTRCGQ